MSNYYLSECANFVRYKRTKWTVLVDEFIESGRGIMRIDSVDGKYDCHGIQCTATHVIRRMGLESVVHVFTQDGRVYIERY